MSSTTEQCLRMCQQTAPVHHMVQHGRDTDCTFSLHDNTLYCWNGIYWCGNVLSSLKVTVDLFDQCSHIQICAPFSVSKINVKETHCTVTDLLPNAQYELWVTATNTTGISPASEKALYMTGFKRLAPMWEVTKTVAVKMIVAIPLCIVPSPPVIKQRECTSCPEAALIRWESGNTNPVDSYTVELSEMGTDGTQRGVTE